MRPAGLRGVRDAARTRGPASTRSKRERRELPPEYEARLRANAAAVEYFDSRPPWYRRTADPPGDEREAAGDA